MTHYLLSVYGPAEMGEYGSYGSKEEMEAAFETTDVFNEKLKSEGCWVFAGGLASATSAAVIDGQGDKTITTDGPYLETKEVLAGFWIVEAPDEVTARRLAAEGSKACHGEVEVRAFEGLG